MGFRPLRFCRITNGFAAPGNYASVRDIHGPAGHHTGIDLAGPIPGVSIAGKTVRTSVPGEVVISDYNATMGNWVGVYFEADDVLLTYWHMESRAVEVGDHLKRGQIIGKVGTTGNSTAPHLHVQANRGRTFDYHGHIAPGRWVRGKVFAGTIWFREKRKARKNR